MTLLPLSQTANIASQEYIYAIRILPHYVHRTNGD